jgi:hypothetical protein
VHLTVRALSRDSPRESQGKPTSRTKQTYQTNMKFLITWKLHPGKLQDTLAKFAQMTPEQDQALMGNDIKFIGRWHDLTRGRGAMVIESDSAEAVSKYSLAWNGVMDLEVSPVLDDAETRAITKS